MTLGNPASTRDRLARLSIVVTGEVVESAWPDLFVFRGAGFRHADRYAAEAILARQ
jgi:hypothetical protein